MQIRKKVIFVVVILIPFFLSFCEEVYIPKPREYFRIAFPTKSYGLYSSGCPYRFELPNYSVVYHHESSGTQPCWVDIFFPDFDAEIHISYKEVSDTNLLSLFSDSRSMAYKHTVKADAIKEQTFEDPDKEVYGNLYEIKGNVASSLQFYLTDSVHHFFRGSLYFNVKPNKDSLAPVVEFLKADIMHLIESFQWREVGDTM